MVVPDNPKERVPGQRVSRQMKRLPDADYWCLPQSDGHPTLYFRGHTVISRAQYIDTVGAPDCDPHIATGRRKTKAAVRKSKRVKSARPAR
jgi:hypothetical protein